MSLKTDLIAAKALIDTPHKWCKGSLQILSNSPPYARFCIVGACRSRKAFDALQAELPEPFSDVSNFNDAPSTTHADIMRLFDSAINAASFASLDAAIAECAKPLPRHA